MNTLSSKQRIEMSTSTLSQAIMLKCQKKDFSEKSETKILTLIHEHMLYKSVQGQCRHNGRYIDPASGLFFHFMASADVNAPGYDHYQPFVRVLYEIIARIYFCEEITKSIAILTNTDLITNGQRRELILVLLRSTKVAEDNRLRREIAILAPIVYPDLHREFIEISEAERQRFISSLTTMITKYVKDNRITRLSKITGIDGVSGNNLIKNKIESLTSQLETQRLPTLSQITLRAAIRRNRQRQLALSLQLERDRMFRSNLHKELGLLFSHMDKIRDLSPGDKITVYIHEGDYYTQEECMRKNIPMNSEPIVLEYMNESEYLNKCNAFKAQFPAVL